MGISTRFPRVRLVWAVVAALGLAGCRSQAEPPVEPAASTGPLVANAKGEPPMKIEMSSTAFAEGKPIPKRYTGEGEDVSPPLAWKGVPAGTNELALICDDPDAPTPEPWVHWVIYKIPADAHGLPEDLAKDARLDEPPGALQGRNSWPSGQTVGYRGPMPPPGHGAHRYFFKLYALDVALDVGPAADKKTLLAKMSGHVIGQGQLMGTYER